MKYILVPTDFSENSYHALDYALTFFAGETIHFYILNVQKSSEFIMDDLMASDSRDSIHKAIASDNKEWLDEVVLRYRKKYGNASLTFEAVFDYDTLPAAISQFSSHKPVDLVVMGTNGATGAREAIFGSNTLQVIRKIDLPILAVPEEYVFDSLNEILLTVTDRNYPTAEQLKPLTAFIEKHQPHIYILLLEEKPGDSEVIEANLPFATYFKEGTYTVKKIAAVPIPAAIASFVQLNEVDLHALIVQKKNFLERFVYGSTSAKISYGTKVPLLVLKD